MDFLKSPSILGEHGQNILAKGFVLEESKQPAFGKHAEVFFFTTPGKRNKVAVKRQYIRSPMNQKDRAYRELRIFNQLSKLPSCKNYFVSMVNWFKIRDSLFPNSELYDQATNENYMHFVMEYAENTLFGLRDSLDLHQYKSVLFQILFALNVSQRDLEFNHNDLHLKNILLKWLPDEKFVKHTDTDGAAWYTSHYSVKICDFGLSRLKIPETGEILYNEADSFSELFCIDKDVMKIASEFSRVKITNWNTQGNSAARTLVLDFVNDEEDSTEEQRQKQEKSLLMDLKKQMNKGKPPSELIRHKFFENLKKLPPNWNSIEASDEIAELNESYDALGEDDDSSDDEKKEKELPIMTPRVGKTAPQIYAKTIIEKEDKSLPSSLIAQLESMSISPAYKKSKSSRESNKENADTNIQESDAVAKPKERSFTSRRRKKVVTNDSLY